MFNDFHDDLENAKYFTGKAALKRQQERDMTYSKTQVDECVARVTRLQKVRPDYPGKTPRAEHILLFEVKRLWKKHEKDRLE